MKPVKNIECFQIWTFGCNDEGALGRATSNEKDEGTPKQVSLPVAAVAVSAGDSHSAALLQNGDVYAWGSFRVSFILKPDLLSGCIPTL